MIAFIVLLIINMMILKSMDGTKKAKGDKGAKGDWTVYGTMGCGWTRKQLDHMKAKGIAHTFVDCDKDGACPGMDAFPTMKSPHGEKVVGFKEV
tara:strand:- start:2305 stop:2586 length:282 start_codon:yes stop_codon:yes gene_type:complete